MTENKRFIIYRDVVYDTDMKIPATLWSVKKQQKKFCDELNVLHEENEQLKQQIKDMKIRFKRKYDHEFDEIVDELL